MQSMMMDVHDQLAKETFKTYLSHLCLPSQDIHCKKDGITFYGETEHIYKVMKASEQWSSEDLDRILVISRKVDPVFVIEDHDDTVVVEVDLDENYEDELDKGEKDFLLRVRNWLRDYVKKVSAELEQIRQDIYELEPFFVDFPWEDDRFDVVY